ncbi:MAG: hypothetical protein KBD94_02505, partial [Pyrinomonadaceae bacterium]|nr:hypothetical protein [Pyrinomonadaceae bacterium]
MKRSKFIIAILAVLVGCSPQLAQAQFALTEPIVTAGGGRLAVDNLELDGIIGQPFVGAGSFAAPFGLSSGFWSIAPVAATITVNTTAENAVNNGTDCTIGDAIRAANTDTPVNGCAAGNGADTIVIPAGTYTLSSIAEGSSTALPIIRTDMTLSGAGPNLTIIERSLAPLTPEFRILAGIWQIADRNVTLSGLTIRNGKLPDNGNASNGGALFSQFTLTIADCAFANNQTGSHGGAINASAAALLISNSTFSNNRAGTAYSGGAIMAGVASGIQINNSHFSDNTAHYGGAIAAAYGTDTFITDSTFTNNQALLGNGGAVSSNNRAEAIRSVFSSNTAHIDGGAIYGNPVIVRTSVIQNNTAVDNGGGIAVQPTGGAWISIDDSTISGNQAGGYGGGTANGTFSMTNSTVSGNSAGASGGGITAGNAVTMSINNSTITNNTADSNGDSFGFGGGIHTSVAVTSIKNSIIAGNIRSGSPDCQSDWNAPVASSGYNLIGNAT